MFEASKYGICLFHFPALGVMEHFHWMSTYCVVLFHTLFPCFYQRTLLALNRTFRDISPPPFALAPTFLLPLFSRCFSGLLLHCQAVLIHREKHLDFCFVKHLYTWLWGEGITHFDCLFLGMDAVAMSHHLIKDVKIGEVLNASFSSFSSSLL